MCVLIIEDEEKTADYLHRGLTEQGYTVDVAREGVRVCTWRWRTTTRSSCWM